MNSRVVPRNRIGYFFDEEIGIYTFKKGHPMRPLRMKITDELIRSYEMDQKMKCFDSTAFDFEDSVFYDFHSEEYIDLLKNIDEENIGKYQDQF
jgi:histone deacetylase 1/2